MPNNASQRGNNYKPGRRPDYKLSALHKGTEYKGQVGAAWLNDDGSIAIKLNAFVVLSAIEDLAITLFPNDDDRQNNQRPQNNQQNRVNRSADDETPF